MDESILELNEVTWGSRLLSHLTHIWDNRQGYDLLHPSGLYLGVSERERGAIPRLRGQAEQAMYGLLGVACPAPELHGSFRATSVR